MKITKWLSELPNDTMDDGQEYIQLYDAMETVKRALEQEPKYCDRNICLRNEYNGIGCDECEVTKSQEPCDVFDEYGNYKYPSDVELTEPNTATSMPCEDAINRANLISKLEILERRYGSDFYWETRKIVDKLPSVKPLEPKTGHWINPVGDNAFCECCGRLNHYYGDYCKCCGARMQAESENKE